MKTSCLWFCLLCCVGSVTVVAQVTSPGGVPVQSKVEIDLMLARLAAGVSNAPGERVIAFEASPSKGAPSSQRFAPQTNTVSAIDLSVIDKLRVIKKVPQSLEFVGRPGETNYLNRVIIGQSPQDFYRSLASPNERVESLVTIPYLLPGKPLSVEQYVVPSSTP